MICGKTKATVLDRTPFLINWEAMIMLRLCRLGGAVIGK